MITLEEINNHNYQLTTEIEANLKELVLRINKIRALWGKPMIVTSGLRSEEDQKRINPKASKSRHLTGEAVDIYDPNNELEKWLKENPEILEDAGLWCEDGCSNWVHFQTQPPKSGKRWFTP